MKLSDNDKQLIALIHEQVGLLQDKGASDPTIINTLFDMIPHALCILENHEQNELTECQQYLANFSYFCSLIDTYR